MSETDVVADDATRVKLAAIDDDPGSDYINANFMPVSDKYTGVVIFYLLINIAYERNNNQPYGLQSTSYKLVVA